MLRSPSSLFARHLSVATVVLIFVLNWRDTVNSRCVLEVDRLALRGRGAGALLLQDTFGWTRVFVGVHLRSMVPEVPGVGWAERRRRHRRPWHWAWWSQRESWTRSGCRSRDAEGQLWFSCTCGVHFCFALIMIFVKKVSKNEGIRAGIYESLIVSARENQIKVQCKSKEYDLINKCISSKRAHEIIS